MKHRPLVVATTNPDKVREILDILAGISFEIVTLDAWPGARAPEETGTAFEANARAKALHYAGLTGELTAAEDSGLEIDALNGKPGVESARFGGPDSTYSDKFGLIYRALEAAGRPESPARFVCAAALARGQDVLFEARGTIEGHIAPEPRGSAGFGYDPIFFYPPLDMTLAEAGHRKHGVSHRAEAFRALKRFLDSLKT